MRVPVPLYDQRSQTGLDGRPPEDGNQDCVPESLAAMCAGITSLPQNGDAWHDAVYGQGYIGMQDPARYVAYARGRGMALMRIDRGSGAANVAYVVSQLAVARPVLLAIPSDWNNEPPRSPFAHMVAACDISDDGQTLTAMNPWGGFYQSEHVDWWAERLQACAYHSIWIGADARPEVLNVWHKETNSAGQITGAHDDKAHHVGPGIYSVLSAQGWLGSNALYADYIGTGDFLCILDDGHGLPGPACEWLSGGGQHPGCSTSALALVQQVEDLKRQLAEAQSAPPATPPSDPPPPPASSDALAVTLAAALEAAAAVLKGGQ